jgi:hypothetical protein
MKLRVIKSMRRSYVPIYQDKKYNSQIYFDYEANEFFTTPEQKPSSLIYLSGFVGIVFYAFFKNISFDIGLNPSTIVLLCMILGTILGFASIKLAMNVINKGLKTGKISVVPTKEQIKEYINMGKKQSTTMFFMIIFLLFLSLVCSLILYFMPTSALFILITPASWAILIIFIWAVRPIKKIQVYNQLKSEL